MAKRTIASRMKSARIGSGLMAVALATMLLASGARAQNYDGDLLLRFGAFGQANILNYGITLPAKGSTSASGAAGGLSVGIDYAPSPYYIMGIEMDASMGDARGNFNDRSYGLDYLFMLRGRFGVRPTRDWLLYGAAGVAFFGFEAQSHLTNSKAMETVSGLTIGLGAEYNLHHVILFGEYNYAAFGERAFTIDTIRHSTDADAHMLRLGIKFNVGHDYHNNGSFYDPMK